RTCGCRPRSPTSAWPSSNGRFARSTRSESGRSRPSRPKRSRGPPGRRRAGSADRGVSGILEGDRMELIGRILDGSIPQDPEAALRRGEPSGPRVSHDEKIRHLEEVPLLADCTQKQLRSLSDISRVVEVPTGTSLTRAGQPGDEFFVILDGSAAVEKPGKKRAYLKPGDFFGE